MELPEDIPHHRAPPRHNIDVRTRHSIDLSRARSVRAPVPAAAAQASTLSRGTTSASDSSSWDNVSDESKGIIRQVTTQSLVHAHVEACRYTQAGCQGPAFGL